MEPIAVLEMYKWLYQEHHVIVERFVCDDDSSIKAKLKWNNEDHMANTNTTEVPTIVNRNGNTVTCPDHGGVPKHMPEPSFLADPNHRRKTLASELFALKALGKTDPAKEKKKGNKKKKKDSSNKTKEDSSNKTKNDELNKAEEKPWNLTMTKMDVRRLSKNFAFMARTLQNLSSDDAMLSAAKAVLEHHFDNYQYCGAWCRSKLMSEQQQKDDNKFFRHKTKDALLYAKLQSIIARFVTLDALKEVTHNMDTCANESFNNTISWLVLKNKVYCGPHSLKNRICVALEISTLGIMKYFHGLFERLEIDMTPNVHHYLQVKSNNRQQ